MPDPPWPRGRVMPRPYATGLMRMFMRTDPLVKQRDGSRRGPEKHRRERARGEKKMRLEITEAELEELRLLVDHAYRNLKEEIYKTEVANYKRELKAEEAILVGLRDKLGEFVAAR